MRWSFMLWLAVAVPVMADIVRVPVADVRSDHSSASAQRSDDKEETQVLFGENVVVAESSGAWRYVHASDQQEFTHHNRWEGYPGWVRADYLVSTAPQSTAVLREKWTPVSERPAGPAMFELPLGAHVHVNRNVGRWAEIDLLDGRTGWIPDAALAALIPPQREDRRRELILANARKMLGDPYAWGGRSPYDPGDRVQLTGVDCSGLVHLSYYATGLSVPRDAHEQWMRAAVLRRRQLKPADVVFSAPAQTPDHITHVALYTGKGMLLEAPQTGLVVREISFRQKYGRDFARVESGDKVGDRIIYFGRLLP